MKQIISISSVFIGLVIGAGFASGREIFEYFNIPSSTDLTGIAIATISFGAICYITMHLAQKTKCHDFDTLVSHLSGRFSPAVKLFMFSYMFCGFFVMMSACGALTSQILNISPQYGIWLLALVCFFVFSFDLKGLVTFNAILVPLMAAGMLFVCLSSAFSALPAFSALTFLKKNPLLSALCYVSYNTITAGAVLVPLSTTATKKQLAASSALSGAVLGTLIFVTWSCMNLYSDRLFFMEIPLLELARDSGRIATIIYTLVLFMALCTTAVSQGFGILSKLRLQKLSHRCFAAAALCLLAMPFARLGFSELVSGLYSAFGYAGLLWTALVLWKYTK